MVGNSIFNGGKIMGKNCPVMLRPSTKKALSGFKSKYEDLIIKTKPAIQRRFVSWDDTILFAIDNFRGVRK